jgi:hypothetical protein
MIRWKVIAIIVLNMAVAFSPTVYFHACCCGSEQSWFLPPDDCCEDDHHEGIGNCCSEESIHLDVDDWTSSFASFTALAVAIPPSSLSWDNPTLFLLEEKCFGDNPNAPPLLGGKRYLKNHSLLYYDCCAA